MKWNVICVNMFSLVHNNLNQNSWVYVKLEQALHVYRELLL